MSSAKRGTKAQRCQGGSILVTSRTGAQASDDRPSNAADSDVTTYDGSIQCVHVLGHPDRPLDMERFPADAQVFNCSNLCKLLSLAKVPFLYYGLPGSRIPAGGRLVDLGHPSEPWQHRNARHQEYTFQLDKSLRRELASHPDSPRIVVSMYGCAQADIEAPDELNVPIVEAMVGYDHCWAPYRVFPSYSHQSVLYTDDSERVQESIWFDTVIPHFVDKNDYWPANEIADYALFMGRNTVDKGCHIAEEICDRAGIPLTVVHDGVGGAEKTELISRAIAVFMPTIYVEPFGYVAVEAQMCGVPAITTDWGAFSETVEQGKTGFRCRSAAEFTFALKHALELDRTYIRDRAVRLYSVEAAIPAYMTYFDYVWETHHSGGFYAEKGLRQAFLNWNGGK